MIDTDLVRKGAELNPRSSLARARRFSGWMILRIRLKCSSICDKFRRMQCCLQVQRPLVIGVLGHAGDGDCEIGEGLVRAVIRGATV